MTLKAAAVLALFGALFALPLLPAAVELWRKKDDAPLDVNMGYTRDPRFFGTSLRSKLDPHIAAAGPELPCKIPIMLRRLETLEVHANLRLPANREASSILAVLGRADIGVGSRLAEVYVRGNAWVARRVRLRSLACDGELAIGKDSSVERWIDSEGDMWVGRGVDLGISASSGGTLHIERGCRFQRLWGLPVACEAATTLHTVGVGPRAEPAPEEITIEDVVMWGKGRLSLPRGIVLESDIVAYSDVRVGAASIVRGSIKSHGSIFLAEGAHVEGNLVARGGVCLSPGSHVLGDVFAEDDVVIGAGSQVGGKDEFKTVYTTGTVRMAPDALVFGWLVAEQGGKTER